MSLDFFVALERQVWDALQRGDAAADVALLADDFVGIYTSGFATRAEHAAPLHDGPAVAAYSIDAERLMTLGADAVALSYRARWWRPGSSAEQTFFITSIWQRRDGRWLNVMSQDTPAL